MTAMARPAGADSAKYDPAKNPVYQIDLTTASTGKFVAQTKRRVRWRFGFSSAAALSTLAHEISASTVYCDMVLHPMK